jgi:L-glyceraldehyde 3-phosphate reductase
MNLEYVDLFYSHRYDAETPLEETLQALVDIVKQGKALYIGISRWPLEATRFAYEYLAARDVPCLIYQGCYNLFNRQPEKEGILSQAKNQGVGFIGFSPLAQGLLTDRYLNGIPTDSRIAHGGHLKMESLTETTLKRIHALNEIALQRGQTLAEMSIAWILQHEAVTSVIVGASSTHQLSQNLKALQSPTFCTEELEKIERVCTCI